MLGLQICWGIIYEVRCSIEVVMDLGPTCLIVLGSILKISSGRTTRGPTLTSRTIMLSALGKSDDRCKKSVFKLTCLA